MCSFAAACRVWRGVAAVRAVGSAGAVDATLAYLAVYSRRDGSWRLIAYQSTPR